MESANSSCLVNTPQKASNYDEFIMQHSLIFAESLKDLKNLRKQLYSAAEYFELSYHKEDDHEQLMVETLKDYLTKALVSTVDHLGSVAYKVNNFLDEKVNEISGTKVRFSCMEQRLRTYQEFVDREGSAQQSLAMKLPKYHKRYIVPAGEPMPAISNTKSINYSYDLFPDCDLHPPRKALQATSMKSHSPFRKGHSGLSFPESPSSPGTFSFTGVVSSKEPGKRAVSPLRLPLKRSGSLANKPFSQSHVSDKQWSPLEPQRSISMWIHPERDRTAEIEQYSKRSKRFFKALFSIHRSRKEDVPYRYHDGN